MILNYLSLNILIQIRIRPTQALRHATQCHATPSLTMPYHARPDHATPCHATPCHAMPRHATPWSAQKTWCQRNVGGAPAPGYPEEASQWLVSNAPQIPPGLKTCGARYDLN